MPAPTCTTGTKAHAYGSPDEERLPDQGNKTHQTRRTYTCRTCGCIKTITGWRNKRTMRIGYSSPTWTTKEEQR